jgi:hypothetical protein
MMYHQAVRMSSIVATIWLRRDGVYFAWATQAVVISCERFRIALYNQECTRITQPSTATSPLNIKWMGKPYSLASSQFSICQVLWTWRISFGRTTHRVWSLTSPSLP